jgi:hypothetical protein
MIDQVTATIAVAVAVEAIGGAILLGDMRAEIRNLKARVAPIAALGEDIARLEGRIGALLERLPGPEDLLAPRRGRRHAHESEAGA